MLDKKCVTYEQFGAVGDGVTDDFAAIYKAHEYANENGLPVVACDTATYYIHNPEIDGVARECIVKTDVNWGNASFIIDDRDISVFKGSDTYSWYTKAIFHIEADHAVERIDDHKMLSAVLSSGLNRGTKKIPLPFDYPVMIIPYNSGHNVYRRIGYGGWAGEPMHEVILLDEEGNVSEQTPVMFDYKSIDYIDVYRADETPITVEGGIFTTRSTRVNTLYRKENGEKTYVGGYIFRGLYVTRSNTTVKNVKHYITDEPTMNDQVKDGEIEHISACYRGFYIAAYANHVTFDGCVMTGRRCYKRPIGGTGGTYDLAGNAVNMIVFKNCTQSNFWIKVDENNNIRAAKEGERGAVTSMSYYTVDGQTMKMHWGVGGTNFCKNMEYHNCILSRFDAHMGLYNGKVIDSTVNCISITGNGDFVVENTRWFSEGAGFGSNSLIHLRADYGSTWEGDISVKNTRAYIYTENKTYLFYHAYRNWYFGYDVYFPNLSVEGLTYYDQKTFEPLPSGYEVYLTGDSIVNEPGMNLSEALKVAPVFPDVDNDGDGFVDGTRIPFDDEISRKGVVDETQRVNLNRINPPKYIKITSNTGVGGKGGYKYKVFDTSRFDGIRGGGFFGKTVFTADEHSYVGTSYEKDTETFEFFDPAEYVK